jgi:hypothetical protein
MVMAVAMLRLLVLGVVSQAQFLLRFDADFVTWILLSFHTSFIQESLTLLLII